MSSAYPELEGLIDGCKAGDRKSQQKIYKLFYSKMYGVCLRYTKNEVQAKDILQDGFIKVFNSVEKFNFQGSFEGWIRRIMVNTAIDFFRKSKSDFILLGEEQSVEDYSEVVDEEEEEEGEYDFKASQIIEAMNQLSPAYRTIFNLYIFENLTHKEIAEKLDINIGTSKSNFAKAKKNLKKILIKEYK